MLRICAEKAVGAAVVGGMDTMGRVVPWLACFYPNGYRVRVISILCRLYATLDSKMAIYLEQ